MPETYDLAVAKASHRDVDTRFSVYHELMSIKVQEVLLVATPYDAYIMEEDGSLASRIINEYHGLNLSRPPRLIKVSSGRSAMEILEHRDFDLVLTMPNLKDTDPFSLGRKIKEMKPDLPVILLVYGRSSFTDRQMEAAGIDQTFVWSGDSDLLLAIVKNVEDRLNVDRDTRQAGVRVLILVEDSPLYRSFFLPLIYREVVHQTQSVLAESLNEEHRLMKMRARPKIMVAQNYEQAMDIYERFKPYVFGVMSDTRFPKDGQVVADAGAQLLSKFKEEIPHLPLLLLSSESENRQLAESLQLQFVDKNSPRLASELHDFFLEVLGFGDFVFRRPDRTEIGRAASFRELQQILPEIPDEPIYYQAARNRFSNWFMARSEIALASVIAKIPASEFSDVDALRAFLIKSIQVLRKNRQKGVVAQFSKAEFDPAVSEFVKSGKGSLGGKARGLAYFASILFKESALPEKYADIRISVPGTLVAATDCFDQFIAENNLKDIAATVTDDEDIAARFLEARLPEPLAADLTAYLEKVSGPLSVRSSGLFEDAYFQPYSGLYKTYMIPNNHPDFKIRRRHLFTAVKLVYASTFFKGPLTFKRSTRYHIRRDSMALMVQQVAGTVYGEYFYPAISGVAQSKNYYPVAGMQAEEGIVRMALGMGKTVDEGKGGLRFSPARPEILPQFSKIEDILENAQYKFYALKIEGYDDKLGFHRGTNLESRDITEAVHEYPLTSLCSTYIPTEHRIRDSRVKGGAPVLTFASVLKYDRFPLAPLMADLLKMGQEGLGCDVEVEFCLNLHPDGEPDEFSILQVRPMTAGQEHSDIHIDSDDRDRSFYYSHQCLGNGLDKSMRDIIYVKPDVFDAGLTRIIASEISQLNAGFKKEGRKYLLIGPGRWGSADRWLGIPVRWADISQAGAIIEIRNRDLIQADASQGSHFFQHITARGLQYVTITEGSEDFIDWAWLEAAPLDTETQYLRHVRLESPMLLKADGRHGHCAGLPGTQARPAS